MGCGKAKGAVLLQTQKKMCEACGLKPRGYGLAAEGKVRWCGGCGKVEGAVPLNKYSALHPQMCEDCGLKSAAYGLASKGRVAKVRWCAGCAKPHKGAVDLHQHKMCEGCGLARASHGLASEGTKRWCAGP